MKAVIGSQQPHVDLNDLIPQFSTCPFNITYIDWNAVNLLSTYGPKSLFECCTTCCYTHCIDLWSSAVPITFFISSPSVRDLVADLDHLCCVISKGFDNNCVYLQARDDILNGSHPVSFDKACEFGGIQTQIQFGPHIEHKHKSGFLE